MSLHADEPGSGYPTGGAVDGSSSKLQVLCLCAQWCGVCRDYRQAFEQLGAQRPSLSTYWIDIEDEEASLEDVEITTFPVILILNQAGDLCFSGPVVPHLDTLRRLCAAAAAGSLVVERESTQCWQPLLNALRATGRLC